MNTDPKHVSYFQTTLYQWAEQHPRPMPWKGEKDPYKIWLSEIILQQTRVDQGWSYYNRFVEKYPDVFALASAPEDALMKLWEGLGYYSRARNLHASAKAIVRDFNGVFPSNFERIRALKGVGDYTAAAISSFAFQKPYAVVDGNVVRVLSRYLGVEAPFDTHAGKKTFKELAARMLDEKAPHLYNQALMDFGALQCVPANPNCAGCPFVQNCKAFAEGRVEKLPLKSKKMKKKQRFFHFLILNYGQRVLIRKRVEKDIWRNLYEFPLIEAEAKVVELDDILNHESWRSYLNKMGWRLLHRSETFKQTLSHQQIMATFWELELENHLDTDFLSLKSVDRKNLGTFAFPKVIDKYLKKGSLTLKLV